MLESSALVSEDGKIVCCSEMQLLGPKSQKILHMNESIPVYFKKYYSFANPWDCVVWYL